MPRDIQLTHEFSSPVERVFAALDDHANMGRWLGGKITLLKRAEGGGVGTVRRLHVGFTNIDEEVIEHQAPSRLVYRIVAGMPLLSHHRGEVRVEPRAQGGSTVHWHVQLDSRIPGVTALIAVAVGGALKRGLVKLDRQLAR